MKRRIRKTAVILCMAAGIGGICIGCTTQKSGSEGIGKGQDIEAASETQEINEVIEKVVEIESGSDDKIEFSMEGSALMDDTAPKE